MDGPQWACHRVSESDNVDDDGSVTPPEIDSNETLADSTNIFSHKSRYVALGWVGLGVLDLMLVTHSMYEVYENPCSISSAPYCKYPPLFLSLSSTLRKGVSSVR